MSKLGNKEILDNNFTERIESFRPALINILMVIAVLIGSIGTILTFQKILTLPFYFSKYIFLLILFLGLILYPTFIWINAKKYIFTPNYILISSRFFRDKRIDNIKGFKFEQSYHSALMDERKEVIEVTGVLYIFHKNGSIKLDSYEYGNFYNIQKFIEKHYDSTPLA